MIREVIYEDDFLISENKRIVLKLIKIEKSNNFPTGLEFTVQYLYFKNNEWIQIVRIDNQLHEGKPGTHVNVVEGGKIVLMEVEKVTFENLKGKYDLYTEVGTVVVDNIVASTLAFFPHDAALFWWRYFNLHPEQYKLVYDKIYSPLFRKAYNEALEEINKI